VIVRPTGVGLHRENCGITSPRRTKASVICKRTGKVVDRFGGANDRKPPFAQIFAFRLRLDRARRLAGSINFLIRITANSRHKRHRSRMIVRPLRGCNAHSVALFTRKSKRRREAQNIALRHRAPNEPCVLGRIGPIIGKHNFLKPPNKSPRSSVHSQDAQTRTSKPARRPRLRRFA
jgi:hypothetical protein